MAGGQNEVSQVVRLNGTQYRNELGRMQTETRSDLQKIGKDLVDAARGYQDFTSVVKKNTGSMISSIEDAGKSFAKNLGRGVLAGGAIAGVDAMRAGMREAAKTGLEFDVALAKIASRADLSAKQISKLKSEFFELGKTGAKLQSIPAAFDAIYGATGNLEQSKSVMGPIAKAAAMGNGDASEVADFVKDRLKDEGKDINQSNVQGLLHSLVLAQRGGEFNSLGDAMQGMGGISGASQKRAGLSDREMAGILAGSSRAGTDKATGVAAAQALVHMSQQGFGGSAALAGMLGVGSFMNNGKFDTNKLNQASANQRGSGRSDSDSVALFQGAGLSEQESTGLVAILKNVEKFQEGVNRVANDTKGFDQTFQEVTDTLSHRLEQLKNATVHGFDDIFSPLMGIAKKAAGGNIASAMGGLPGAIGQTAGGAMDHPFLVGGALLATAAGGSMLKKLGLGGAPGLARGVATGKALSSVGVQPVYVTNAGEISTAAASDPMKEFGGTPDVLKEVPSLGGALRSALGVAKFSSVAVGAGLAAGKGAEYIGSGEIETDLKALIKALMGKEEEGQKVSRFGLPYGGRDLNVKLEVVSKNAAYMFTPTITDNARDPKGM